MRNAETVLSIIRDRGSKKLPMDDVYRQLFNPGLYLRAYVRLYANDGAMTQGTTEETVDGMSQEKINAIIEAVRQERWQWTPVRRVEIPKKNGKTRPLGIPTWSDKILQEVMRSILEAHYEPRFADASHGFRPGRGCHTALHEVQRDWTGTKWFIEGDIKGCFDNIDHEVLMSILRENIIDNRFLLLVEGLLKAGYHQEWQYHPTHSGTPQGGVISPILSNIYMDRLDRYIYDMTPDHTKGKRRAPNREYMSMNAKEHWHRKNGRHEEAALLRKAKQTMPTVDPDDPDYRRLKYVRYADDFMIGFVGPRSEAVEIKEKIKNFLKDSLKLELSEEKTLITHSTEGKARFLGYDICTSHSDTKMTRRQRVVNGRIALRVPTDYVTSRSTAYMRDGKPIHRKERTHDSDYSIMCRYQAEWRGYVQYYLLAENVTWLDELHWVMRTSLLKTLANKHRTTTTQMAEKYAATVKTERGPRKCLEVIVSRTGKPPLVGRFGGIPLVRKPLAEIEDRDPWPKVNLRSELLARLITDECELCGSTENVQVHRVRKLADVNRPGRKTKPAWMTVMASRKRKTLVVCLQCHTAIHNGTPTGTRRSTSE